MQQPDLFPEETAKARMEREAMEQPRRGKYHDRKGQFTDRLTAEIAAYQREIAILKKKNAVLTTNFNYYKRVNTRLSNEVREEQLRCAEWEAKYKSLLTQEIELTPKNTRIERDNMPC